MPRIVSSALKAIFTGGGHRTIARAAFEGISRARIRDLVSRTFSGLQPDDVDMLTSTGIKVANGAKHINDLDPNDLFEPDDVEIVPGIFGEDPQGRRYRHGVRVDWRDTDKGTQGSIFVQIISSDELSRADLFLEAEEQAGDIFDDYPERIGHSTSGDVEIEAAEVIFSERAF